MASIKEVARAAGVSTATVSRILNDRLGAASVETRERVLRVVEELHYQPSAVARGLSNRRMHTLGVVMVWSGEYLLTPDTYHTLILDGILAANRRARQKTLLYFENDWEEAEHNASSYCDGQCDGLILLTPATTSQFFETLRRRHVPFAVTGGVIPDAATAAGMDELDAGATVTRHLIEHGHRRIAHLTGPMEGTSAMRRAEGYRLALTEAEITVDESLILLGVYSEESGYERTRTLLERPREERPTAIFCADDAIAYGTLRALREAGVSVPEEISVMGINGGSEGNLSDPPLTSLRQPFRRIGSALVDLMIAQIEKRAEAGERALFAGEIVARGSVGMRNLK